MIPSLSPRRGGPSFVLPRLAEELSRRGLEITVATTDDDGWGRLSAADRLRASGESLTYSYHARSTRFYSYSNGMRRWLRDRIAEYDLVHVHAVFSYPSTAACRAAHRRRIPYIVRPLGVLNRWGLENRKRWLKSLSLALIDRPLLNASWAIHCTSEAEAREVGESGIKAPRVVIPNPVQVPETRELSSGKWRRQLSHLAARKWLLFLSRIDPKKGLESTLEALATLPAETRPLLLVAGSGEPDYQDRLRHLQRKLGLERDVEWLGFIEGSSKWDLYHDSDAFVLHSNSENFGIAVAEAMGSALPVLISDQVGLESSVRSRDAGLVVPLDVRALAEAIPRILAPEACVQGLRGKEFVQQELSFESVANRIIGLYRDALKV